MSDKLKELKDKMAACDADAAAEADKYANTVLKAGTTDADDLMEKMIYVRRKEQECYLNQYADAFTRWHQILMSMDDAAGMYIVFPDPGTPVSEKALYYFASCGGMGRSMAVGVLSRRAEEGDVKAMIRLAEIDQDRDKYLRLAARSGNKLAKLMLEMGG